MSDQSIDDDDANEWMGESDEHVKQGSVSPTQAHAYVIDGEKVLAVGGAQSWLLSSSSTSLLEAGFWKRADSNGQTENKQCCAGKKPTSQRRLI